eukprot:3074353-Amphidinium_carterae.1
MMHGRPSPAPKHDAFAPGQQQCAQLVIWSKATKPTMIDIPRAQSLRLSFRQKQLVASWRSLDVTSHAMTCLQSPQQWSWNSGG